MSTLDSMTSQERKDRPVYSGVINYFPDALAYVALISKLGNDKHNPGQPLHWSRDKSSDHKDCVARHLIDAGKLDPDGIRHSGMLAWRALANLQIELETDKTFTGTITNSLQPGQTYDFTTRTITGNAKEIS